jgi:hypothetical protein
MQKTTKRKNRMKARAMAKRGWQRVIDERPESMGEFHGELIISCTNI